MYINHYERSITADNFSFEQLYNNALTVTTPETCLKIKTIKTNDSTLNDTRLWRKYNLQGLHDRLQSITHDAQPIDTTNIRQYYTSFQIPKRTGGLRQIDAPTGLLQTTLKKYYETFKEWHVLPTDAAHAYTEKRDTYTAITRHKNSNWFLKIDIKDFFPSCTKQLLLDKVTETYPFSLLYKNDEALINRIFDLCLLDNKLPQGTNMSPLLTNILMVPFDYCLQNYAKQRALIYTRYADDIIISSQTPFNFKAICATVNKILHDLNYPFRIKKEKTRYGSNKGANWNLGLMVNKENNITIGHKNKKIFKAMINNFLNDLTKGTKWSIMDVHTLLGLYSYYHRIEPDYIDYVITQYSNKYNKNALTEMKNIIKDV